MPTRSFATISMSPKLELGSLGVFRTLHVPRRLQRRQDQITRLMLAALIVLVGGMAIDESAFGQYSITGVGTLGVDNNGRGYSYLNSINEQGVAVGYSDKYDDNGVHKGYRGIVWDGSQLIDIGTLGVDSNDRGYSYLNSINEQGIAVGNSTKYVNGVDKGSRGIIWDGSQLIEIGTLGVDSNDRGYSYLNSINEQGIAVGSSAKYVNGVYKGYRSVIWNGSQLIDFSLLGDNTGESGLISINEQGMALGYSDKYNDNGVYMGRRGIVWDGAQIIGIGTLGVDSNGRGYSYLNSINEQGMAVGYSDKYDDNGVHKGYRGIVWDGAQIIGIGTLGVDSNDRGYSYLSSINEQGMAVGYSDKYDDNGVHKGYRGIVWDGAQLIEMQRYNESSGYGDTYVGFSRDGTVVGYDSGGGEPLFGGRISDKFIFETCSTLRNGGVDQVNCGGGAHQLRTYKDRFSAQQRGSTGGERELFFLRFRTPFLSLRHSCCGERGALSL